LFPISLYGAGKLACEGLISAYSSLFGIKAWIFRFANVIGGRMGRAVIYDFIEKLKRNPKELEILGDGRQEKPFFLVDDCIDGMLCAFQKAKTSCDIFNLGCDTTTNVTRVAEIVVEEMGLKNVRFKYTGGRRGWVGDVPQVKFNVEKMKDLGWQTKYTSDEAVCIAARRILGKEKYESAKIH
jgi:UDP-glucose 4-epimerase